MKQRWYDIDCIEAIITARFLVLETSADTKTPTSGGGQYREIHLTVSGVIGAVTLHGYEGEGSPDKFFMMRNRVLVVARQIGLVEKDYAACERVGG